MEANRKLESPRGPMESSLQGRAKASKEEERLLLYPLKVLWLGLGIKLTKDRFMGEKHTNFI